MWPSAWAAGSAAQLTTLWPYLLGPGIRRPVAATALGFAGGDATSLRKVVLQSYTLCVDHLSFIWPRSWVSTVGVDPSDPVPRGSLKRLGMHTRGPNRTNRSPSTPIRFVSWVPTNPSFDQCDAGDLLLRCCRICGGSVDDVLPHVWMRVASCRESTRAASLFVCSASSPWADDGAVAFP